MKAPKLILSLMACVPFLSVAATATAPLTTNATLNSTCSFSATPVSFGVWNPIAPAIYANGSSQQASNTINILCNNKTPFTIKGMPYIGKPNALGKYMKGATTSEDIVYTVYTNPSLAAGTWFSDGITNAGGQTYFITSAGTGANQSIPLYFFLYPSAVYPRKWVTPDTYTDNYTLTLTY
jgi:spore coat protein U-like protein